MRINRTIRGLLAVIASAAIYGCIPMLANFIIGKGVTPMTLVFLRNFLALPVTAVLALLQSKTLRLPAKVLPRVSLTALLGNFLMPLMLYSAYLFIPTGTATIFHYVYPAIVVLLGVVVKNSQIRWVNVISVAFCFVGIFLFYSPDQTPDWTGSILAVSSGLGYACYVMLLSHRSVCKVPGFLFSFYISLSCSVVSFIACLITGQLALPATAGVWGLCALLAVAVTAGAVVLFQIGTYLLGPQQASIFSSLAPIVSVVLGAIVLHEAFGFRNVLGSVFVVLATTIITIANIKKPAKRT